MMTGLKEKWEAASWTRTLVASGAEPKKGALEPAHHVDCAMSYVRIVLFGNH